MSTVDSKILIVIPARGQSKGVPRKALRPLNNKPLITYSIATALKSKYKPVVVVSSEDEEIQYFAEKQGAKVHKRPDSLSGDLVTLDPVIFDAMESFGSDWDLVVTLQPTSPLLRTQSLDSAIEKMLANSSIDTCISAAEDTHLTWKKVEGRFSPNYERRVNRQELPPVFRETGSFLISRPSFISPKSRIGPNVDLFVLSGKEAIDIDTFEDWNLCEFYLKRKKILFVVSGFKQIGLGHVYNTLILAEQFSEHEAEFLVDAKSELAKEKIEQSHYRVTKQSGDLLDHIYSINPDIVINDRLDTGASEIQDLKKKNMIVINFEDLGSGASEADLVFNAIYPEKDQLDGHYFGPEYYVLREEFYLAKQYEPSDDVKNVLLSFGGVDPNDLTKKCLDSISNYCREQGISVTVVAGMGYEHVDTIEKYGVKVVSNVTNMAEYVEGADVVFTSAGRTIYEVASIGVPTIVLAQNEREMTHFFADDENGFLNLGLGKDVSEKEIIEEFQNLVSDSSRRRKMSERLKSHELRMGRFRVVSRIRKLIEDRNYENIRSI